MGMGGAAGVLLINGRDELEAYTVGDAPAPLPSLLLTQTDGDAALAALAATDAGCALVEVLTDVGHELRICNRLPRHQNIVEVVDSWMVGEAGVVIFEACSGGKVAAAQDTTTALWLAGQLLAGLAHLHAQGVCHRDLKPDNLLLTRPWQDKQAKLVIIDFSMASTCARMKVACGSPQYIAPEVLSGCYSRECDLWSAGMIMQEWLYGKHPFRHLSDTEVLERLVQAPDPLLDKELPMPQNSWHDLLRVLLAVDPASRPTAAQAMGHPCLRSSSSCKKE